MIKMLIFLLLLVSSVSAWWTRVDCQYKYVNGRSGYIGLYRNSQGNYIQMFFYSYCPVNIN